MNGRLNANGPGKLMLPRAVSRTGIRLAFFPPGRFQAFRPSGDNEEKIWRRTVLAAPD